MQKTRKLLLLGDSAFAEVAYEYFTRDSAYDVVGFAVERPYLKREELFGLPVIALDEAVARFPPAEHDVYVAMVYTQLNRLRTRLSAEAKSMGYALASFISPQASVWPNVALGEHCFVFENNVVQPFVKLGNNVVLWSGNHIGHHSVIRDNVFVSSHVVVSGFCEVGANSFLGVNATLGNNVTIGEDCWLGPGLVLTQDAPANSIFRTSAPSPAKVAARRFFRVDG